MVCKINNILATRSRVIYLDRRLYRARLILFNVRITLHIIIVNELTRILSIRILRLEETYANKEVANYVD